MKTTMKTTLIAAVSILAFSSCQKNEVGSADAKLAEQTERSMLEANRQVGMPAIKNYQERKLMKMILELRDQEDFVCHAYLVNMMTGEVGQYLGKCVGYGLPYSVQFTNPDKIVDDPYRHQSGGKVIAQPDPNGLFMPDGLSATWLMLIDPETGDPRPVYVEPQIMVSPFPLHK